MKGNSRLLAPVASTAVANGLITVTAAIGGIVVARALGPGGRGDYAVVLVVFAIIQVFAEGGVQGATTYFAARDEVNVRRLIRDAGRMLATQGFVATLLALGALSLWGTRESVRWAFVIILVGLTPTLWLSSRLFALQGVTIPWWNGSRLIQAFMYVGVLLILAFNGNLSVEAAAATYAVSSVSGGLVAAKIASRRAGESGRAIVSRVDIRSYATPNLAWTVPVTLSARVDQIGLALFASSVSMGRYAVSLSLITLATPVVAAIGNVSMPALSRAASKGMETESAGRRMVIAGALTALIVSISIASVSVFVIPILFGDAFDESVGLCWLLVPAAVAYATKWVAAEALRGLGAPGAAAKAEWIGLLLVIGLTLPGVAIFGTAGAALAPVVGYCLATILMLRALKVDGRD